MSTIQQPILTGVKLRLGEYCICLFDHGLTIFGPCPKKAHSAEIKLVEMLATDKGCKLFGNARRVNGHPASDAVKSELESILGLSLAKDRFRP